MNIRMYDCHFGDCFKLVSDINDIPLIVDFGIHNKSVFNGVTHNARYDQVIRDFGINQDYLLSHFHEDHYEGVIYAADNYGYQFKDIYIPDIWHSGVEAIALVLLKGMITKYVIRNGLTLIDFLLKICKLQGTIYFVKRGTQIRNDYIALWPTNEFVAERAKKLFGYFNDKYGGNSFFSELLEVSSALRNIVVEFEGCRFGELIIVRNRLDTLIQNQPDFEKADMVRLADFGNEISIIFQNNEEVKRNILFTGDVKLRKKDWISIERNDDQKVQMYDDYNVIKIPHHGTERYYHSFCNLVNDQSVLLIPNGKNINNWNIYQQHSADANITNTQVVCSDRNSCNASLSGTGCVCQQGHDICCAGAWYYDI